MKHVFIINPIAGFENSFTKLSENLRAYKDKYDITIYVTSSVKDATEYSREFIKNHPNDEIRFYSCGGDGTLGEVVNGIVNLPNASVTCYPCGSGNDFVKSVGGKERFLDLDKLFNAKNKQVDLIKINDSIYSLNVINIGFEAKTCQVANMLKGKSKHPYTRGIVSALFTSMLNHITVEVDGEVINPNGTLLLSTFANGGYEGGKYNCAPRFKIDDGLIEVCLVKPISVLKFLSLVKKYEKGEHLDDKKLSNIILYRQAKRIKLTSKKEFLLCVDGEIYSAKEFNLEIIPKALNFALPENT
ncbi:MAG: YegS/Rv2252/BmrU family lipid kinase [Clostridiales bacterium]|nr:YegS/Rv2252/BmrU family lipid kinase [Clostridiales bacterium]